MRGVNGVAHETGTAAAGRRGMIALRYFLPSADLRPYLSSYYVFRADLPRVADIVRADLGQLRFMLAGQGSYQFAGGTPIRTPAVSLVGPTMAASRFEIAGPALVVGVGLLPAGWAAVVREDANRLVHQVVDGRDLFGAMVDEALDAMRSAPNVQALVAMAEAVLRTIFARAAQAPAWFTAMTESWLTGSAAPSLDTLIAEAGMSARQLERLANRIYGAPPKLLARKYRALRAAGMLADPEMDWRAAAGDAFYDQSHFIREFKLFNGLTPRQYQAEPSPVTRLIRQRRGFAAQVPKIAMVR
jgi:AraC-like DNA-binding protein